MYRLTAVGMGPGDPELITLKGMRAIEGAQIIFVPRSRDGGTSLALRIAEPHINRDRQQVIELPLPMTRNVDQLTTAWQAAADSINFAFDNAASDAKSVNGVYLLLGDPLLYGTFTYIWGELTERYPQIEVAIVPGVTSFAASAAKAQIPLSTTSDRVAILPASYETDGETLRILLLQFDTVILMKAGPVLPQLLEALQENDLLKSTVYTERIGMPEEKIVTDLSQLPFKPAPYMSLLIVRNNDE